MDSTTVVQIYERESLFVYNNTRVKTYSGSNRQTNSICRPLRRENQHLYDGATPKHNGSLVFCINNDKQIPPPFIRLYLMMWQLIVRFRRRSLFHAQRHEIKSCQSRRGGGGFRIFARYMYIKCRYILALVHQHRNSKIIRNKAIVVG